MLPDIMSTILMADSMLQILHMMLQSVPLSVSYKSPLRSFLEVIIEQKWKVYVSCCLMKLNGTKLKNGIKCP